jgi:ribosomal protein L11 methyltransferase
MVENQVSRVSVERMDTIPAEPRFDVILANINKHVILQELATMKQQLKEGGVILLSGLLVEDFFDIENEALKNDIPISERLNEGNWISLKLIK